MNLVTRKALIKSTGAVLLSFCCMFFLDTTYASCAACQQAPKDLGTYLTTMDKLLTVLDMPPAPTSGDKTGLEEVLFASKAIAQRAAVASTLTFVLGVHVAFLDLQGEISTLAGTEARRRDREQLVRVDDKIMKKALRVASKAYIGKRLTPEQLQKVDTYLQELGYVELQSTMHDGKKVYLMQDQAATYDDLLSLYRNMNYLYKKLHEKKWYTSDREHLGSEFLRVDSTKKKEVIELPEQETITHMRLVLKSLVEGIMNEIQSNQKGKTGQWLVFKEDYKLFEATVRQISDDYACAIGTKNQCDSDWKEESKNSREKVKEQFSDKASWMNNFTLALERLRGALWSKDPDAKKAANQREASILRTIYGGDTPPERTWFGSDNPNLPNGTNLGVAVDTTLDIEPGVVENFALLKQIEQAWKLGSAVGEAEEESFANSKLQLSNVPQDEAHADAAKYMDKSSKIGKIQEMLINEDDNELVASWAPQHFELNNTLLTQKRDKIAESLIKEMEMMQRLQDEIVPELAFKDVKTVTKQFPVLSAAVYRNSELRGKKNEPSGKSSAGIYNSMGQVCELQCSNLQGRCRYYTD